MSGRAPAFCSKVCRRWRNVAAPSDVVFDRMEDAGECARIIANYTTKVEAEEVRLARCGEHIWVRLQGRRCETVNLVLRTPRDTPSGPQSYPQAVAVSTV